MAEFSLEVASDDPSVLDEVTIFLNKLWRALLENDWLKGYWTGANKILAR